MAKTNVSGNGAGAKTTRAKKKKNGKTARENLAHGEVIDRLEAYRGLAERRAAGEPTWLPRYLPPAERRLHVRQILREDHAFRIAERPEAAKAKFDKLAASLYDFFRGTALLFYRDMAGEDANMPTVLALGDVHPENFGVMPSHDEAPMFGVNDFDEAYFAPFTWDLKRGVVGFYIAAKEHGLRKKKRRKIVRCFVKGYLDGIASFAKSDQETVRQIRIDNAPSLLAKLLESSLTPRSEFLAKLLDEKKRGFRPTDELVPRSSRREEFQKVVDRYAKENGVDAGTRLDGFTVKDVAEKMGSGTASLGLPRYYVLLEGPAGDGTDDIVIELKRARRSALHGLVPPSVLVDHDDGLADRVVNAQAVHLVGGDAFYGKASLEGNSYLVRERSPFKKDLDLDDLSPKEWQTYALECGHVLAQSHALADEDSGIGTGSVEARILEAVPQRKLFLDDLLRFAERAVARVEADHAHFAADHARGAFEHVDIGFG